MAAGRPTVAIHVTRDSVAMGDDVGAPHARVVAVPAFTAPAALARHLARGYLASVGGVGHAWSCVLNGRPVATILGNGWQVRAEVPEVTYADTNAVHFVYTSAQW